MHPVKMRDVDNQVDQVLHVQGGMPALCWGSLWEEGFERLDEVTSTHDVYRGQKPERCRCSNVVTTHGPLEE